MSENQQSRLNDFVIKVATVNGTGSQSANNLLLKAIFRMGVPVVGKNFFPSNIQGLSTWYEIRVTGEGYKGRSGRVDLMIAMNGNTYRDDLKEVSPGGILLYDSTWPRNKMLDRPDITVLGIPLAEMCNAEFPIARTRILMKNMAYVGAAAALLDIDMDVIRELIEEMFEAKKKLIPANMKAVMMGYDYAKQHFACPLPFKVARLDKTRGHIMIDGNTATGLGCVYAGATFGAWYPITPSTSVMDGFKRFCEQFRYDEESGKANFAIVQAEDELASIGMVIGAGWNGARAFTPTSGPGISLMSEFLGLGYYAEIPAVVFDVQRVGPSTGMPTRTQQSDIMAAAYASHGDTKHVVLFPADPRECFEMAVRAFDLAERLQTPVLVLSDLDIGMNDWMIPDLEWDDAYRPDRGKVLSAEELENTKGWSRYADVDGDGIPYRTLPGTSPKGAYFTRGSGHNSKSGYTEKSDEYKEVLDRLLMKWNTAKTLVPKPVLHQPDVSSRSGILSLGSCDGAVTEARDRLAESGIFLDYMRVRAFPFTSEVEEFIASKDRIYVVEQNRDAQLKTLLMAELGIASEKLVSVLHYDGMPIPAWFLVDHIRGAIADARQAGEAAE